MYCMLNKCAASGAKVLPTLPSPLPTDFHRRSGNVITRIQTRCVNIYFQYEVDTDEIRNLQ